MFSAAVVLIISTALCLFYFQILCEMILRREFDRPYFRAIVNAIRLEFPHWRKLPERTGRPVDYPAFRLALQCDFDALTYLLKKAGKVTSRRHAVEVWLLVLYFRLLFLGLAVRRALRLREKAPVLKLTAILQYFANTLGQRVNVRSLSAMAPSEYVV